MKTKFNEYGEIIEEKNNRESYNIEDLLKDVPVVNWREEFGIKEPTRYARVHDYLARRYVPTLLNLKDKILRYLK